MPDFIVIDELSNKMNASESNVKTLVNNVDAFVRSTTGGTAEFTANGNFTVPMGVTKIWITACGGGGGGSANKMAGEGGQFIVRKPFTVVPGATYKITIGAGGAAGTTTNSATYYGSNGGTTSIGNVVSLLGGRGGNAVHSSNYTYPSRGGAPGHLTMKTMMTSVSNGDSNADYSYHGENTPEAVGGSQVWGSNTSTMPRGGGASLGNGGEGCWGGSKISSTTTATVGTKGGGGGGGNYDSYYSRYIVGSKGAPGYVFIEW